MSRFENDLVRPGQVQAKIVTVGPAQTQAATAGRQIREGPAVETVVGPGQL